MFQTLTQLKEMDMYPSLWFQLSPIQAQNYFTTLVEEIEKQEHERYPNYRDDLEKKWDQYRQQLKEEEKIQQQAYQEQLNSSNQDGSRRGNNDCSGNHKDFWKVRDAYMISQPPPLDSPHPNMVYSVRGCPIPSEDIENLMFKMERELNLKHPDKHPLIRGLRRGIGLYIKFLPLAYLQLVQRMAQDGLLGVVISDAALAFGVNMPFRSVVFCGDHKDLTPLMAQQMAGRAGRRGMDKEGHLVYLGLSENKIQEPLFMLKETSQGKFIND